MEIKDLISGVDGHDILLACGHELSGVCPQKNVLGTSVGVVRLQSCARVLVQLVAVGSGCDGLTHVSRTR